jgi:hypothetical protein
MAHYARVPVLVCYRSRKLTYLDEICVERHGIRGHLTFALSDFLVLITSTYRTCKQRDLSDPVASKYVVLLSVYSTLLQ